MKTKFLLLLFFIGCQSIILAQDFNKAKLDSLLDAIAINNKGMGSLSILQNGQTVYSRAIGYSVIDANLKMPSNPDTRYRIGSITKTFTAAMVFQLIEEKKLTLNTRLADFFPEIKNAERITIGNLLNHRSGIHNFTNDPGYISYMNLPKTQADMLTIISQTKPDFEPNTSTAYSNANYVLLGYIIEKLTKKTYADNIKTRIADKAQLKNTYVGEKINREKKEAISFNYISDWTTSTETDMSIPGGAGAIVSTATDLTLFINALFAEKLVTKTSLEQMKTITDGLGMGLLQIPFYERKAYGHNGSIDGFLASLAYFEKENLAIAYCSNGVNMPFNDILIGVLSIYFNKPYAIPSFKTTTFSAEDLAPYLGVYSGTSFPLKITILNQGNKLFAQASGQSAFPLEFVEKDKFRFSAAGITMMFDVEKNELTFTQGPGKYTLAKE